MRVHGVAGTRPDGAIGGAPLYREVLSPDNGYTPVGGNGPIVPGFQHLGEEAMVPASSGCVLGKPCHPDGIKVPVESVESGDGDRIRRAILLGPGSLVVEVALAVDETWLEDVGKAAFAGDHHGDGLSETTIWMDGGELGLPEVHQKTGVSWKRKDMVGLLVLLGPRPHPAQGVGRPGVEIDSEEELAQWIGSQDGTVR
jgi:hypothetical protein